ncbi:hypothetical protein QGN32_13865 [Mycolicibacterium sp. ND9-15]|uniref:hypothetical protein n=1 Tax=Mycolicibacterium sp. ND9-15 TaxID=3042320 RepID=UPI002DD9544D|nr:hypothetical protein [Mycolicibacterium sp. ND9-15]WSE54595.1 hypothetical protein QGN32_13865 [Mycolicibacterium sp. ND9-15]
MTTALTLLILASPLAVAAAFARAARHSARAAPVGRHFEDDRDMLRFEHDLDAIRTRFERQPAWPRSGAIGERR